MDGSEGVNECVGNDWEKVGCRREDEAQTCV